MELEQQADDIECNIEHAKAEVCLRLPESEYASSTISVDWYEKKRTGALDLVDHAFFGDTVLRVDIQNRPSNVCRIPALLQLLTDRL